MTNSIKLLAIFFIGTLAMHATLSEARSIRDPRFSPDGRSIIFDLCNPSFPDRCRIHRYDLNTGNMYYYLPPEGQTWMQGSFSDSGEKLAFVKMPTGDRSRDLFSQRYEIFQNSQIAIMNADGSNERTLTASKYYKGMPAFSHDEKKIIYAQAEKIRDSGSTIAAFWDIIELDLNSLKTNYFAGQFKFYQIGASSYFNGDSKILINGDTPLSDSQIGENGKLANSQREFISKYKENRVFELTRGQQSLQPPFITGYSFISNASITSSGDIFFIGYKNTSDGLKVRCLKKNGDTESWPYPPGVTTPWGAAVSKDGNRFILISSREGSKDNDRKLMLLNTETASWTEIILPDDGKQINKNH